MISLKTIKLLLDWGFYYRLHHPECEETPSLLNDLESMKEKMEDDQDRFYITDPMDSVSF